LKRINVKPCSFSTEAKTMDNLTERERVLLWMLKGKAK